MLGSPSSYVTLQPLSSEFPYIIAAWEGETYKWNGHNTMFVVILCPSARLRYNQASHAEGSTGAAKPPPPPPPQKNGR
jgi:hypothetical protein